MASISQPDEPAAPAATVAPLPVDGPPEDIGSDRPHTEDLNPQHALAPAHLPWFITGPGGTDYLFNVLAAVLIAGLIAIGNLYFKLHALPERWAHNANPFQVQLVAVLSLLALFTHQHLFWVAALFLALVRFPDFATPIQSAARSLEKMALQLSHTRRVRRTGHR